MDDKTYRRLFMPGTCSCGKTFRSYQAEAVHRHNFPALCKVDKRRVSRVRLDSLQQRKEGK
jgi:hypothetical protein